MTMFQIMIRLDEERPEFFYARFKYEVPDRVTAERMLAAESSRARQVGIRVGDYLENIVRRSPTLLVVPDDKLQDAVKQGIICWALWQPENDAVIGHLDRYDSVRIEVTGFNKLAIDYKIGVTERTLKLVKSERREE